jgi:hypothetical protein
MSPDIALQDLFVRGRGKPIEIAGREVVQD